MKVQFINHNANREFAHQAYEIKKVGNRYETVQHVSKEIKVEGSINSDPITKFCFDLMWLKYGHIMNV